MNSINPIQIQFGTLCFGVKIEDDENNMVPVAPFQIKIEGRNFIEGYDGYIMTKPRTTLLQGGENDELMAPQNISASNQMQWTRKYYKKYDKLGCDLMDMWRRPASIGGSKLGQIAEFTWESVSPQVQFRIQFESNLESKRSRL
jgi:hypothetical protein